MSDIEHRPGKKIRKALLIILTAVVALAAVFFILLAVVLFVLRPPELIPVDPVEARRWIKEQRRQLQHDGRYNPNGSWKGPRVALIAVDGLDLDQANRFVAEGLMPNLAHLMKEGATGKIQTLNPALSPRIWTTIATGVLPQQHGILNIITKDSHTGGIVPFDASHRKSPALWQMASDFGLEVLIVNYWPTWPAEKVNGVIISDLTSQALRHSSVKGSNLEIDSLERLTYPLEVFEEVLPLIVKESEISAGEIAKFFNASESEISDIEEKDRWGMHKNIEMLRLALVYDTFSISAGLKLYRDRQPDLFMVYFKGLDLVCHRFWKYHEPEKFPTVSGNEIKVAGKVIERYYQLVDEMLGKLLMHIPRDSYVIVMSDHGFRADPKNREISGTHFKGVWFASLMDRGPNIKPGTKIRPAILPANIQAMGCRVTDITPTILTWLGLPLAENFMGRPYAKLVKGLPKSPIIPGYPHVPPHPPQDDQNAEKYKYEKNATIKNAGVHSVIFSKTEIV